ncbi:MAG TPA: metal-dependent hydrolase [Emcibacteraceae bacterium]|nr:metal-dependent hydrolase [Emcibacteraceae bacterium]
MDPLTQGAFGALFSQTNGKSKNLAKAALIGAIAGMAPDLDILIQSPDDPLLALEYHRHFTHSLFFIPFGGLLCAAVLHPLLGRRFGVTFLQTLLWCVLGYATHGLLDSCTSYGTQLFLPFTDKRVAWDIVSIIDPLVTVPLLVLICFAAFTKRRRYTIIGIVWISLYFSFSFYQQGRAVHEGQKLAEQRGLNVINIEVKPSFANILIWKIITTTEDSYYVDAVKVGWNKPIIWEGEKTKKLDFERDLPWLDLKSRQGKDVERFRWFSNGYIALDKNNPYRVVDIRYSLLPQEIKPLWGIELSEAADQNQHVRFYHERGDSAGAAKHLWDMLSE